MTRSAESVSAPTVTNAPTARAWILALAVGLAASLITWAASETLMRDETGMGSTRGTRIPVSPVVYSTQNGMTAFGLLGATLGLGLGIVGGVLRGSSRSAILAGLIGLALGGGAGVAAARGLVPFYFNNYSGVSLTTPLLVHGGLWMSIALAAGFAFGLGLGGIPRAIEALAFAIPGALLATFLYEFTAIWLFSMAQPDRPLPVTPVSRFYTYLVTGIVVSVAMALCASRARSSKSVAAPVVS